jgi:hypothetical protein
MNLGEEGKRKHRQAQGKNRTTKNMWTCMEKVNTVIYLTWMDTTEERLHEERAKNSHSRSMVGSQHGYQPKVRHRLTAPYEAIQFSCPKKCC